MDKTLLTTDQKTYSVPSVVQAIRVMLCLADNGNNPKSLTEICREIGIHRSKAFSILNTLNTFGFVKKNPNRGGYVLGPGLLTVTGKMLETLSLPRIADPVLSELAKKSKATVSLGVISEDKTYIVSEYQGAPGIGISSPLGYVTHMSYGAHGKAIAAFLPPEELNELLKNKDLYFYGRPEKYSKTRLLKELAECRQNGFSVELGDIQKGMNAIAAPVFDENNYPVGYVTIVGFFSEEKAHKLGPMVVEAAKMLSQQAGHMLLWRKANKYLK